MAYLIAYHCPSCQASLQVRADRPDPWLRCPKCGRASQPGVAQAVEPQPPAAALPTASEPVARPIDDRATTVPQPQPGPVGSSRPIQTVAPAAVATPSQPARALAAALARREETTPSHDWRVLYGSVFFVAVTMLVFSTLDASVSGTSFFGAVAFLCLIMLVLPGRTSR